MTFLEKYLESDKWHDKVIIMELFHLIMSQRKKDWTVTKTAKCFMCSTGLTSENLRLARAIHDNPKLLECESRQQALIKLNGRR